jgi:23S rRNA (uracil1939-C5)-methyltransferase
MTRSPTHKYDRADSRRKPNKTPVVRGPGCSPNILRRNPFSGKLHRGLVTDSPSADLCVQKTACGSCALVNTDYSNGLRAKFDQGISELKKAEVLKSAHILDPVPSPLPLRYRTYFKLAVRPNSFQRRDLAEPAKRFAIGLFEPGTHNVAVSMTQCPIHTHELTSLLIDIEKEIELTSLEPWNEKNGTGDIRYITARSSHVTGEMMLTWVVAKPKKNELLKLTQLLRRRGHKINSSFMNINSQSGNAIFGEDLVHLSGGLALRENICDLDLEISPKSFFQINPWQAVQLYRRVELHTGKAGPGMTAWDLYSGTGQIGLILARLGYKTLAIDEVSQAMSDAQQNAVRNKLDKSITFMAARVEDSLTSFPEWSTKPDVIVVNPSRRGLQESARHHIAHLLQTNEHTKLIYVSCDVSTLARDLATLTIGKHKVRQIEAYDMFAQTDKLEWLAVIS